LEEFIMAERKSVDSSTSKPHFSGICRKDVIEFQNKSVEKAKNDGLKAEVAEWVGKNAKSIYFDFLRALHTK